MVKMQNKETEVTLALNKKAEGQSEEVIDAQKKESSDTVTVCCGIPMGQTLELGDKVIKLAGIPMSQYVTGLNGGFLPAGKYGLTKVPTKDWEALAEKYKDCDFMKKGVIFARKSQEEAVEVAVERSENHLGFEQTDPKKAVTKKSSKED